MNPHTLSQRLANLPDAARRKVEALITELERKQQTQKERSELRKEPFVGLWQGRDNMADSTSWVREMRQREWERD